MRGEKRTGVERREAERRGYEMIIFPKTEAECLILAAPSADYETKTGLSNRRRGVLISGVRFSTSLLDLTRDPVYFSKVGLTQGLVW